MIPLLTLCAALFAATPAEEVDSVLQHAMQGRSAVSLAPQQRAAPAPERVPAWSLPALGSGTESKYLAASEPMEKLAKRLRAMELDDARPYLESAAERLLSDNARERAAATELLALVPVKTVELGLLPRLGEQLDDERQAFAGIEADIPQSRQVPPRLSPATFTVGDVARAGLMNILPVQFVDSATFQSWWATARDETDASLWYWWLRWRQEPPRDLAVLDDLSPEAALRIALLVDSALALEAEFLQAIPARQAHGVERRTSSSHTNPPDPRQIASLVQRRKLKDTLLEAAAGELTWSLPSLPELNPARRQLVERALSVLPHVLAVEDADRVDRFIRDPQGALAESPELKTQAVRVLVDLLPAERAEAVLLRELRRDPGLHPLAADLIRQTGFAHWPLIRHSYRTSGREQAEIINAVAGRGRDAKPSLGELLELDDLVPARPEIDAPLERRFVAFVEAANELSDDGPVVSRELLERSLMQVGKGITPEMKAHNREVPEHRAAAVKELAAFFTRRMMPRP